MLKYPKFSVLTAILILILTVFTSCGGAEKSSREVYAMDTYMTYDIYGENSEAVADACEKEIYRLEKMLSADDSSSELYKYNSGSAEASAELNNLIGDALHLCEITDGALDITVRPLLELWGFCGAKNYTVPTNEQLSEAVGRIGYDKFADGDQKIDLGAVAKGYTSGKLAKLCEDNGIDSALFDLGGNIRVVGAKPDGSLWKIGISDPDGNIVGTVKVENCAVISSDAGKRFFEKDGVRYHHIMDAKTGYPANSGIAGVSIISDNDFLADALSTAIFAGGEELANELYKKLRNFGYIIIRSDNTIAQSLNIEFEITNDKYK